MTQAAAIYLKGYVSDYMYSVQEEVNELEMMMKYPHYSLTT